MKDAKKKVNLLEIAILFCITLFLCFRFYIAVNEMDVIPFAQAAFSNWLPNDWYLNLSISYRDFLNYLVGFCIEYFGIIQTVIGGRILSYLLFSIGMLGIAKTLGFNRYQLFNSAIIFLVIFASGYGAGERLICCLETKAYAYVFILISIVALLKNHIKALAFFCGLALSFHILIGLYHCAAIAVVIGYSIFTHEISLKNVLKSLPYFVASGVIGIYGIIGQLLADSTISTWGWEVYVNIRVPHHTNPESFRWYTWVLMITFLVIGAFYLKKGTRKQKKLSIILICAISYAIIGIGVYIFFPAEYLRFYFFRYGDAMAPLLSIILISSSAYKLGDFNRRLKKFNPLITVVLLFSGATITSSSKHFFDLKNYTIEAIEAKKNVNQQMMNWIQKNTSANDVFITHPSDSYFYIHAERSVFVLWKSSPQNARDIEEWYERLKLLNGGENFENEWAVYNNYDRLTETDILAMKAKYPELSYILVSLKRKLQFPLVYQTESQNLYHIQ